MTVITDAGHAMFFNGVSDAVVIPNGIFAKTGKNLPQGGKSFSHIQNLEQSEVNTNNTLTINDFTIEAWVIPDQGGVVFEYENLLKLSIGNPTTVGPLALDISLRSVDGGESYKETISTASPRINRDGDISGWDGLVYPSDTMSAMGSHRSYTGGTQNVSALTLGHRELLQIVVKFTGKKLTMYVNGDIVASRKFQEAHQLSIDSGRIFLGGRGGEFRGIIETIHWSRGASDIATDPCAPLSSDSTLGLWRFREPVSPVDSVITIPTVSASTSASTINIGATAAAALYKTITGNTASGTVTLDLTASPYSTGSYKVDRYTESSNTTVSIPHVPYNLLINPVVYDRTTGKPNNLPPERVRVTQVVTSGNITVESIHLDYTANATNGRRGLIHTRSITSEAVLVMGDCLVDNGTGEPYQLAGTATQFAYRTGQVVIDESSFENHGIVTSLSMATNTHTGKLGELEKNSNQYSVDIATGVDEKLLIGHTGRHFLNHVKSHSFMGRLPDPSYETLTQKVDGISDVFDVQFPDHYSNVKDQIAINSQVSLYDTKNPQNIINVTNSSQCFTAVENGMAGLSDASRALLAIGGVSGLLRFDPTPFLLKSTNGQNIDMIDDDVNSKSYIKHLTPISESRIAVLEVPSLESEGFVPFVELHYNAIDMTGSTIEFAATTRLTASIASNVYLTCTSVKGFGQDGDTILAENIVIDGTSAVPAGSAAIVTISHSNNRLTFSLPGGSFASSDLDSDFKTKAVSGAIVHNRLVGPVLLIEKTVPDVSTTLPSGKQIIDVIHEDLSVNGTVVNSPGGIIDFEVESTFGLDPSDLVGDDSGGFDYEADGQDAIDTTQLPSKYAPIHSSDPGQSNPTGILANYNDDAKHVSTFHKLVVGRQGEVVDGTKFKIDESDALVDFEKRKERAPSTVIDYSTGVFVSGDCGGIELGQTQIPVYGESAISHFPAGTTVYHGGNHSQLGVVASVGHNLITLASGSLSAINGKEELYNSPFVVPLPPPNQKGGVHVDLDIIDASVQGSTYRVIVQPNNRQQHTQLNKVDVNDKAIVNYMMSKGRVLSFGSENQSAVTMICQGINSDIAGTSINLEASGSTDSHIVKEILPGAPVVTVTLGGAGQGAINTKETWDPSSLSRLGWNTRRDNSTQVVGIVSGSVATITVNPLNNNSEALSSWGAYGFPKVGRLYFNQVQANGEDVSKTDPVAKFASVAYTSRTGNVFTITAGTGHLGKGIFKLADGSDADSLADWASTTGLVQGSVLQIDDKFNHDNICSDGTTINDRLFQSLNSVQHDYQLGTQYASTRAMVEIPLFEEFFFDNLEKGIFPGPDNSMKLHVDATYTAHTWAPNPVGRRAESLSPQDPEINSAYSYTINNQSHSTGTKVTKPYDTSNRRVFVEHGHIFPDPQVSSATVAGISGSIRPRRAYLPNGEWVLYSEVNTGTSNGHYLQVWGAGSSNYNDNTFSRNFLRDLEVGALLSPAPATQIYRHESISDNPLLKSAGYEGRRPYYYDRANMMTQGGNVDYGMRQYVSAVEFRAGPTVNPHLDRIQSGLPKTKLISFSSFTLSSALTNGGTTVTVSSTDTLIVGMQLSHASIPAGATIASIDSATTFTLSAAVTGSTATVTVTYGPTIVLEDASNYPLSGTTNQYEIRIRYDQSGSTARYAYYASRSGNVINLSDAGDWTSSNIPSVGAEIIVNDFYSRSALSSTSFPTSLSEPTNFKELGFLNRAWANPYAPGGLRYGDTVWMNMHYTNPHAIEGYFCKSRGVLNENLVHTEFNGGKGGFGSAPRSSIPLENFLIGNSCLETAQNFVQHVNKSVEMHKATLATDQQRSTSGYSYRDKPLVAYIDPYQSTEEFTRVLLYDVAHDREFIAFQDIWMQVQTSPDATRIGYTNGPNPGGLYDNTSDSANAAVTKIDVPPGYESENTYFDSANQNSEFIEAAYSHGFDRTSRGAAFEDTYTNHGHGPYALVGGVSQSYTPRTNDATISTTAAQEKHLEINGGVSTNRENSTFFDTPDGTRAIPAFLALKGIRYNKLDLSKHREMRLQYLPHWTDMDFTRRLCIDLGEVGVKEGVTDIEAAAQEVVRLINQAGAKNGLTHARRPADQYLGESERFDLTNIGVKESSTNRLKDPTAPHLHADFSSSGSTHDPSPFWDEKQAFAVHDRGTHMGYVRAHLGRVVLDNDGNKGYSVIIHSTVPGASGRNFCTWFDSSKAQSAYRPQFLIGHGGRMRNYWCQPSEMDGENMHPAPMPISKHGRPFAPITTLNEMLPPEQVEEGFANNLDLGSDWAQTGTLISTQGDDIATGKTSNTTLAESFETKNPDKVLVKGLRTGTTAKARINFGGITQAGIPGWGPDCSRWGFPADFSNPRFAYAYGRSGASTTDFSATTSPYIPTDELKPANIGKNPFYGIRFVDHRGQSHTIRLAYREYGQKIGDGKKLLPPTIDDEIVIWFDDRDVGQGGFTIGRNVMSVGDACGRIEPNGTGSAKTRKGNLWQTYPSPAVGIQAGLVSSTLSGSLGNTSTRVAITLADPYQSGGLLSAPDALGYLGLPDSGVLELNTDPTTTNRDTGIIIHYESRSHYDKEGDTGASNVHYLYGVTGYPGNDDYIISPRVNWTSLLTDEIIAAAVEHAIKMDDPNSDRLEDTSFDCRDMYAADGRTLGEWGVGPNAIRIKAHAKGVMPLKHLFDVTRTKDWGIQAGVSELAASGNHLGGLSTSEIDNGTQLDVGYIPETVLSITTKYKGTNANTATPVLINSQNNVVPTDIWQQNLRGEKFRRTAGDHIIPCINNYMTMVDFDDMTSSQLTVTAENFFLFITPGSTNISASWGERVTAWINDEDYAVVESKTDASGSNYAALNLTFNSQDSSPNFETTRAALDSNSLNDLVFARYGSTKNSMKFGGVRIAGSTRASPFLYFRGARDSPDHWVPLFFGGGFSGVVMDINDGSNNDYSSFYKHPYSNGPTGCAGLQNIGEHSGSFALLDANAMLAMFPGTAYLDQHKGQVAPPFFNQDGLLSFDLNAGQSHSANYSGITYGTSATNTVYATRPSPIVVRFAHPHARYDKGVGTKGYTSPQSTNTNHTTYMIFGPGQSVPHNMAATEPQPYLRIIKAGVLNGDYASYYNVPFYTAEGDGATRETFLPNPIMNGGDAMAGNARPLPNSAAFQTSNLEGWNYVTNWEPPQGNPNNISGQHSSNVVGYRHATSNAGRFCFNYVVSGSNKNTPYAQPFSANSLTNAAGTAFTSVSTTYRLASMCWHMDGGYHPGGHFLDNHVVRNPAHPVSGLRAISHQTLADGSTFMPQQANYNPTSFRVAGQLATAYSATSTHADYIVVDATRCQNAEELAAVISSAINTFPGTDPLKAIGGTFLPSFQSGHNQDRYGWYRLANCSFVEHTGGTAAYVQMAATGALKIPKYGWLRVVKSGGGDIAHAPYSDYNASNGRFTLLSSAFATASNNTDPILPYDDTGLAAFGAGSDHEVYVWSKTGTHQYNNRGSTEEQAARHHYAQVHFNGLVDAVDRTKPVGAVGWHGEAYSYLNTYANEFTSINAPSGKGAWHSFLGFSPYGPADNCLMPTTIMGASEATADVLSDFCSINMSSRHLIAVTHESELPLIAKADRDGVTCTGDWIYVRGSVPATVYNHNDETSGVIFPNAPQFSYPLWQSSTNDLQSAGTTLVDTSKVFNKSRYVGPATGGPNIEAMIHTGQSLPYDTDTYPDTGVSQYWHPDVTNDVLKMNTPCLYGTGDLFWDRGIVPASQLHEDTSTYSKLCTNAYDSIAADIPLYNSHNGIHGFYKHKSAARNFNVEHVVWKRMGGGNLSMPSAGYRGLGMVPKTVRATGESSAGTHLYSEYEEILGNCRFSFETTNSAMFPIIQAQEIAHPQIAQQHPFEVRNALAIPNEELQFLDLQVKDDTGQIHTVDGGSPFGTIIYDFRHVNDREIDGLSPAIAGTGITPNMKIRLPNPDDIPGNIIVRSGFDRIQSKQESTLGSGGMTTVWNNDVDSTAYSFKDDYKGTRMYPTYENATWEHISQSGINFPYSDSDNFNKHSNNFAPLKSSYEAHDRSLFFHITKAGYSSTKRTSRSYLTVGTGLSSSNFVAATGPTSLTSSQLNEIWSDDTEISSGRRFFRIENKDTGESVICSYTGFTAGTFTFSGVVTGAGYDAFIAKSDNVLTNLVIFPSYYVPAGTTRFFAARRLRDHSEYSGNSPDMPNIDWQNIGNLPYNQLVAPELTPMPIPRMGHHYVTPTMAIMPGHYAHPAYQRMYDSHQACKIAENEPTENLVSDITSPDAKGNNISHRDPLIWFSTPTSAYGPSDIHGDAFTLLTETKIRYEGYGIAASVGDAGAINSQGGHSLVLEAAGSYTLNQHFPDPMEVGAYQIVIQPNLQFNSLIGFHKNSRVGGTIPGDATTFTNSLTSEIVATVIAIEHDVNSNYGAYTLVLSEATMYDVRGCEILMNEVMIDLEPDAGSQFTNIPTLGLYNPLGVNENASPAFSRRSLPYHPDMFQSATPGYTMVVPWWSLNHNQGLHSVYSAHWLNLEWLKPENYYELSRNTFGAIGGQITLTGYPSSYLDIYETHYRNRSLTPVCNLNMTTAQAITSITDTISVATNHSAGTGTAFGGNPQILQLTTAADMNRLYVGAVVTGTGIPANSYVTQIDSETLFRINQNTTGTASITMTVTHMCLGVDNADLFPVRPAYNEFLEITVGVPTTSKPSMRLRYAWRQGASNDANSTQKQIETLNSASKFVGVMEWSQNTPTTGFSTILTNMLNLKPADQIKIRLSGPYNNLTSGEVYTNSDKSIATRVLPQTLHGTRDTNSLHSPDAYLCMWHPNLGRPFTWYSDDASRTFYTKANSGDSPVTKEGFNPVPEHFETIHYHDFFYAASKGPFNLSMKTEHPTTVATTTDGSLKTGTELIAIGAGPIKLSPQGGAKKAYGRIVLNSATASDYDGQSFTITSADGTIRIYTLDDDAAPTDTAVVGVGNIRDVRIQGDSTQRAIANRLRNAIEHSDGHNGKIAVEITDDDSDRNTSVTPHILLLTQSTAGSAGNTAITSTVETTVAAVTDFRGGSQYHFTGYWPGGSRGGPAVSRLDGFADALIGWGSLSDMDCVGYNVSKLGVDETNNINELDYNKLSSISDYERNMCFGYRFGLRQPYNRPRWSIYTRGFLEILPYAVEINTTSASDLHTKSITLKSNINDIKRKFVFENSTTYANGAVKDADARVPETYVRIHGLSTKATIKAALEEAIEAENTRLLRDVFRVRTNHLQTSDSAILHLDNIVSASDDSGGHIRQYINGGYTSTLGDNQLNSFFTTGVNGPFVSSLQTSVSNRNSDYTPMTSAENDLLDNSAYGTISLTYVRSGILERLTQLTALLNEDLLHRQVRYSNGRRMTRPFGCPVRTLKNPSSSRRLYPGDDSGIGIDELANAHLYYMVDWWGNTRGEDVRRFPARGFGIRPAWDPEDAYLDVNASDGLTQSTSVAAKATIVITDYSEFGAGDTVAIVSTGGTTHTFTEGSQDLAAKTFDAATSNNQTATNLAACINHQSDFSASASGAIITVTQSTTGTAGNTSITITDNSGSGTIASAVFNTDFTGGAASVFKGDSTDRMSGEPNSVNNDTTSMAVVDWFNPQTAMRVGDRGDGRGVRWPTTFNESLLHDVSQASTSAGLLLSANTAEPNFGTGVIRPKNSVLSDDEKRIGISTRLGVADSAGLLKPEASVSKRVENVSGTFSYGVDLFEPISKSSPRLGIDADNLGDLRDGEKREYVVISTQAYSLHTDREVGQRTALGGSYTGGDRTLLDVNMTAITWSAQPTNAVFKSSNCYAMWPLGGTYVLEVSSFGDAFDDTGWGNVTTSGTSSNPYQDANHLPSTKTNITDKSIQFLVRPSRILDNTHMQMFRHTPVLKTAAPQSQSAAKAKIIFTGAASVDETITIIDYEGTSRTYTAKASTTAGSREFVNTDAAAAAAALKTCIEHSAGHNGKILVTLVDTTLHLTQAGVGSAGNTVITEALTNVTVKDFEHGSDNGNNFYRATSGGKYGMFNFYVPSQRNAITLASGAGPHFPVYTLEPISSQNTATTRLTVPISHGPLISGSMTTTFQSNKVSTNAKATATITIVDTDGIATSDKVTLRTTSAPSSDVDFTVGSQDPASRTWAKSFTDATCDYNNDPTITMDSTANVQIGMSVSGTGIPAGATVVSINSSTSFELSVATTGGSKTNQTLTFTSASYVASNLAACIDHQSDFNAFSNNNVVFIQQNVAGEAGNTTVSLTDASGSEFLTALDVRSFVGGVIYSPQTGGLSTSIGRIVMSENTLSHFYSDAARRITEKETGKDDRSDYSVPARYSQSIRNQTTYTHPSWGGDI